MVMNQLLPLALESPCPQMPMPDSLVFPPRVEILDFLSDHLVTGYKYDVCKVSRSNFSLFDIKQSWFHFTEQVINSDEEVALTHTQSLLKLLLKIIHNTGLEVCALELFHISLVKSRITVPTSDWHVRFGPWGSRPVTQPRLLWSTCPIIEGKKRDRSKGNSLPFEVGTEFLIHLLRCGA